MLKVLVVVGPTASGKSALAVRLAKRLNGEVISADSRQVYKGLNIGTGKISKKEMQGVKHHLLDVASPRKTFTAADFARLGRKALKDIHARNKLAIICGGTGFYIDALLGTVTLAEAPANPKLRKSLSKRTPGELLRLLQKRDPERGRAMNASDNKNPVRLIRAIEISYAKKSGKSAGSALQEPISAIWIGIRPETSKVKKNIHKRLLSRMRNGMVREVKQLHQTGLSWKRMEELGLEYRHLSEYLQGKVTKEKMLLELEAKIWQYAKRQMTYWRRNKDVRWFTTSTKSEAWIKRNF